MRYVIYLIFSIAFPCILGLFLKRKNVIEQKINASTSISFFSSIAFCIALNIWGTHTYGTHIGNFFEKSNYDASYYVYVSDNLNSTKNYRLKADIRRGEGTYYFLKAYWPNGGTLSFDEPQEFYNGVCYPYDDEDKEWRIELTDKIVYDTK